MGTLNDILDQIEKGKDLTVLVRAVTKNENEIARELLAKLSGVNIQKIKNGGIEGEDWPKLVKSANKMSKLDHLFFCPKDSVVNSSKNTVTIDI